VLVTKGLAHRPIAVGIRGAVASGHQLASLAGLRMLTQGGNAIDAAIATAAALNVVEPYMSGLGGVGYLMHYDAGSRSTSVLNYTGTAPQAAHLDAFKNRAEQEHGPKSAMVPAACGGWLAALDQKGTLDRSTVFAPAIEYAELGFPLTVKNEYFFRLALLGGHLDELTRSDFFPGGIPPRAGTIIKQPKLAKTLHTIVDSGSDAFYRGVVAREIVTSVRAQGGLLKYQDLEQFQPFWELPVSANYRGITILSPPPPCAGIQILQTLKLLERFDLARMGHNTADSVHVILEAIKLATADRIRYAPDASECPTQELLSTDYIDERSLLIDERIVSISEGERFNNRTMDGRSIPPGSPRGSLKLPESTTHFNVIDSNGNAVSVTQSLGDAFGSGVMAGSTGLMLNNFNYWFDSAPQSPNVIGPGKRIEMCLAPAVMAHGDGSLFGAIGTPGSFGILQTTPQLIMNVLDHQLSIQSAIEAPRFRAYEANKVEVEARIPKIVRDELIQRGHDIHLIDEWSFLVGGAQGTLVNQESGALYSGADPRRDGVALAF
jgi:gamma-glutamyltranspeptidase / glutathione hydrolase